MTLADQLLTVLNDPTYMWSHALKELSRDSQRLFLSLPLLPQPISADDLQIAYSAQATNQTESYIDSLRALEDSFIRIDAGFQDVRWVNFRNPSLQDFSFLYLNEYSDWLDTLLSSPVYYEQVMGVYKLAMSRNTGLYRLDTESSPATMVVEQGGLQFERIDRWVRIRHEQLILKVIDLALSGPELQVSYRYETQDACSKLKELLEILLTYGLPSSEAAKSLLSRLVDHALKPADRAGADIMLNLFRARNTAEIIKAHSSPNAIRVLRENILDKDTWKFPILSIIDEFIGIDNEESMAAWGADYIPYAEQLANNMSDDSDYEDYTKVIDELRSVGSFLGIDLYDSIAELEAYRDDLPAERDTDDYEDYAAEKSVSTGSLRELDRIFSGLLE